MLTKKSIIQKTLTIAQSTILSRILGLAREALMLNYLAPGMITDAFIMAFKIPNSLRKIFAEGAVSAALVPTLVNLNMQKKRESIHALMTFSIIFFQGILLILCGFIFWKAEWVIRLIAPGWYSNIPQQIVTSSHFSFFNAIFNLMHVSQALPVVEHAVLFLRILISIIIFLSMSALLASALQSVNHFFVPAFGQVIINIVFIIGILVCIVYNLPVTYLCLFILAGTVLSCVLHLYMFRELGFVFGKVNKQAFAEFKNVLHKFLPCLLSMSILEIYLFIDTSLGSFLPEGSISLIYYANRFVGIPLGIFAVAFSTILLSQFTQIANNTPSRLGFYLLESAKLVWWVMAPISLVFVLISDKLFTTLSNKFLPEQIHESAWILIAFAVGLFFFSLNKILLNMYYALHNTKIPFYISVFATILNFCLSYYYLMPRYGAVGIALSTTLAGMVQTVLFLIQLKRHFNITFYSNHFFSFVAKNIIQLIVFSICFLGCYYALIYIIMQLPALDKKFFLYSIGYWIWVVPLLGAFFVLLFKTRHFFSLKLYFLD